MTGRGQVVANCVQQYNMDGGKQLQSSDCRNDHSRQLQSLANWNHRVVICSLHIRGMSAQPQRAAITITFPAQKLIDCWWQKMTYTYDYNLQRHRLCTRSRQTFRKRNKCVCVSLVQRKKTPAAMHSPSYCVCACVVCCWFLFCCSLFSLENICFALLRHALLYQMHRSIANCNRWDGMTISGINTHRLRSHLKRFLFCSFNGSLSRTHWNWFAFALRRANSNCFVAHTAPGKSTTFCLPLFEIDTW